MIHVNFVGSSLSTASHGLNSSGKEYRKGRYNDGDEYVAGCGLEGSRACYFAVSILYPLRLTLIDIHSFIHFPWGVL